MIRHQRRASTLDLLVLTVITIWSVNGPRARALQRTAATVDPPAAHEVDPERPRNGHVAIR